MVWRGVMLCGVAGCGVAAQATYEFRAVQVAVNTAVDIPLLAQRQESFAALAWGNGSTQGYCEGR
jgi:hypothetical protein